jgi:hypothetical protein
MRTGGGKKVGDREGRERGTGCLPESGDREFLENSGGAKTGGVKTGDREIGDGETGDGETGGSRRGLYRVQSEIR